MMVMKLQQDRLFAIGRELIPCNVLHWLRFYLTLIQISGSLVQNYHQKRLFFKVEHTGR
jgi:hypothetical protein